jgi:hypothetical protein
MFYQVQCQNLDTQATLKFMELNTQAQQREVVVQGRSLLPIPALVENFQSNPVGRLTSIDFG